ncbi:MAG: hypothetical protein R2861_04335 [Desulfobacterales bacterium]
MPEQTADIYLDFIGSQRETPGSMSAGGKICDNDTSGSGENFSALPARRSGLKWLAVTALAVLAASLVGIWLVQKYVLVREFAPVSLTPIEEKVLDGKIERVERMGELSAPAAPADVPPVPEPYVEDPGMRTLVFSEKEVNALIAKKIRILPRRGSLICPTTWPAPNCCCRWTRIFRFCGKPRVTAGLGLIIQTAGQRLC